MRGKTLSTRLAALLLAACNTGTSGTYEGGNGLVALTFHGNTVDARMMGTTHELSCSTDGGRITLESPQGKLLNTRNDDGSLDTPWGRLTKKD